MEGRGGAMVRQSDKTKVWMRTRAYAHNRVWEGCVWSC